MAVTHRFPEDKLPACSLTSSPSMNRLRWHAAAAKLIMVILFAARTAAGVALMIPAQKNPPQKRFSSAPASKRAQKGGGERPTTHFLLPCSGLAHPSARLARRRSTLTRGGRRGRALRMALSNVELASSQRRRVPALPPLFMHASASARGVVFRPATRRRSRFPARHPHGGSPTTQPRPACSLTKPTARFAGAGAACKHEGGRPTLADVAPGSEAASFAHVVPGSTFALSIVPLGFV